MRFFRIYYRVLGGHTQTRWFAGPNPRISMGKCGELTFQNEEFEALRKLFQHAQVEFLEDIGR